MRMAVDTFFQRNMRLWGDNDNNYPYYRGTVGRMIKAARWQDFEDMYAIKNKHTKEEENEREICIDDDKMDTE